MTGARVAGSGTRTGLGVDLRLAAATLACLPRTTPVRLRTLLDTWGDARAALEAVRAGKVMPRSRRGEPLPDVAAAWRRAADPTRVAATLARRGTSVLLADDPSFPIGDDVPDRPAVLLAEGHDPRVLDRPRVAIVGTRSATPHGLADARELGAFLARAGVTVVSGLAIGIDAAAHEGALDARGGVVGVVATGLDVVYPRRHVVLFDRVRHAGLIVSETAFGVAPERARFPVRNRIIAALADVVVVVEATLKGGARITAEHALEYGRAVLAVPGSRRNPAATGCNALLADGAHPLLDPTDVLIALGLTPGGRRAWESPEAESSETSTTRPSGDAARVHAACGGEPATVDQLVGRTGLSPGAVAVALDELERTGWIERSRGLLWPR